MNASAPKQHVEYDGYYFIDVVAKGGHKMTIPARGFSLKSWVNFERSLGSTVEFRQVTEAEWLATHWTQTPYVEEAIAKKAVKKAPAKKAVKKPVAKTAPAKKAAVKKTPAKKAAVKKTTKVKK